MELETLWEIETRIRLLNPTKEKNEVYSIFNKEVIHRYHAKISDYYIIDPKINDSFHFLRFRDYRITSPNKKSIYLLNEKRMLDEEFKPTKNGVRVAKERNLAYFRNKDSLKNFKVHTIVSGVRDSYEVDKIEVSRDSVLGCGEYIECGIDLEEDKKEKIETTIEKIDKFAEDLMRRLDDVGIKSKVEKRIYPEILRKV